MLECLMKKTIILFAAALLLSTQIGCGKDELPGVVEVTKDAVVFFEWNSSTVPMSGTITAGNPVSSGYGDVVFRVVGNDITAIGGAFNMSVNDRRLVIGSTSDANTGAETHAGGVFDFSGGVFRFTVDYLYTSDTPRLGGSYLLRLLINNNQTGEANSVLGAASNIRTFNTVDELINGRGIINTRPGVIDAAKKGRIIVMFRPDVLFEDASAAGKESLTNAFFTLMCAGASDITVTGIKLEKLLPKAVVRYSQFGAEGNGSTDDFGAIIETHATADMIGANVKADPGAVYYIGGAPATALIQTDTDWTGAEFIIDDTKVTPNGNGWNDSWVFEITSARQSQSLASVVQTLQKDQPKLDISLSYAAVLVAVNSGVKRYIRKGENENSGQNQTDVFIVDKDGNIEPSAPIIWDFDRITTLTAYPIDENTLTITGGKFTTVANRGNADNSYMKRGINIIRSNTIIDGLVHLVIGEGAQGAAYSGFLYFDNCADVKVQNTTLTGHKGYAQPSQPSTIRGSYDIQAFRTVNLSVVNCNQTNSITDTAYWGIFAANYAKNFLFDRVKFSRVDAHMGVHNAAIFNSQIGHQEIRLIGSGLLQIENTRVESSNYFLYLRDDYGSTWEGDVEIRDCRFAPTSGQLNGNNIQIVHSVNDGTWNFGYPCYLPETITINGFTIEDNSASSSYTGALLLTATNTESTANPVTLTKTITISGYQSGKSWRMSQYLRDKITVNEN